jgi:antitoxin component YwqK of YwqJK toxin-antitoxin module
MQVYIGLFFFLMYSYTFQKKYARIYYENKILKEEGWLLNNQKTDYWFFYYANGNKKQEGHYQWNKKTNWWIFYNEKGNIEKKSEYKNNILHGLTIIYKNNDIILAEKYVQGKKVKTYNSLESFKKDN